MITFIIIAAVILTGMGVWLFIVRKGEMKAVKDGKNTREDNLRDDIYGVVSACKKLSEELERKNDLEELKLSTEEDKEIKKK